jgi:hypothetical protein
MNDDTTKYFYEKYPLLYRNKLKYGLECGFGWFKLLDDLSSQLEELIKQYIKVNPDIDSNELPAACQVKEKFGRLRFYMDNQTDVMQDLLDWAETTSGTKCELCGKRGSVRTLRRWIYCRCDKCFELLDSPQGQKDFEKRLEYIKEAVNED